MLDQGYENEEEMEEISDMTEGLRNFAKQYNYAINDPDLIRRYRMIEDGKRDVATKIAVAEQKAKIQGEIIGEERGKKIGVEEGKKIGVEQGDRNARLKFARDLKKDGYDNDFIAKYSGLSAEEIANL